jgi:hypothetical protein
MTVGKKFWRNRKERKEWARRLQSEDPGLEVVHPHAAGSARAVVEISRIEGYRGIALLPCFFQKTRVP